MSTTFEGTESDRNNCDSVAEDDSITHEGALLLVRKLFQRLNADEIRYCHWKSNLALPASMRGETDLDLLVDPRDAQRFREILGRIGCKPVISDPSRYFPGLEDWLGIDTTDGRLFHLHVHYRLVLGEQLVKNYRLPLERAYLDATTSRHGVKVPVPELELIVLTLRALLKYRDRDMLRDLLEHGRSGIPPAIFQEIAFLRSQANDAQIDTALRLWVPFITPDLVFDFLRVIEASPRAGWKLYRLRRRARRTLAPFQRHSRLRARVIYYQRKLARDAPFHRVLFPFRQVHRKRKTPASGGVTVAIVGVDGAGKSTIVRELTRFLSSRLVTRTYYLGNSKKSLSRKCARIVARVARHAKPNILRKLVARVHDLLLNFQYLADARGRNRNYRAGQRAAAGGAVVIFDRFPLEAIQIEGRTMDGARIAQRSSDPTPSFAVRWLAERELYHYRQILPPDLSIVLQVSAEVACSRKPDHVPDKIAAKCQAVSTIRREGQSLLEIDASRPIFEVLTEAKLAIWRLL